MAVAAAPGAAAWTGGGNGPLQSGRSALGTACLPVAAHAAQLPGGGFAERSGDEGEYGGADGAGLQARAKGPGVSISPPPPPPPPPRPCPRR